MWIESGKDERKKEGRRKESLLSEEGALGSVSCPAWLGGGGSSRFPKDRGFG